MKVLIVGSGGREHALAWKIAQSPRVDQVYVAPGNAGTGLEQRITNVALDVMDFQSLATFAKANAIELTIIGPENPLVDGVVDYFEERDLRCFGPNAKAAILEGSKTFTKEFLYRHDIPTASYRAFTDYQLAADYVGTCAVPMVIKADGLAAGKGVVIARTRDEALSVIRDMLSGATFGAAGQRVVIEEFLIGEEASYIVIADGTDYLAFASSQDHKPIGNGDSGLNTGGMGAYSPAPIIDTSMNQKILDLIIEPTLKGMAAEGRRYRGFLYAGLMIDAKGNPRVIEFNCRFGDPETQPVMMRLESDLADLCTSAIEGTLAQQDIRFSSKSALTVVLAAGGYPSDYRKGDAIIGSAGINTDDLYVFHAGTRQDEKGTVLTNGGRVLGVTALGDSVQQAQSRAYQAVKTIHWPNLYYRSDIGYRAVARERSD